MKTVQEGAIDDYKSIKETLIRRLKYLTDDLKAATLRFKNEGIILAKAKKADQKLIEEILKRYPGTIEPETTDYRFYVVARKGENIVGFAAIYEDQEKLLELDPVWVDDTVRGRRLGHCLVQILLQKQKKKVYLLSKSELEEYYAELGFRVIRDVPEVLQKKIKDFTDRYHQPAEIAMMIEPRKQKPDVSFTERPDLLLIDGGKGQLSSAKEALDALGLTIPVAGLAKREEEIFLLGESDPLTVPKDSPARFLLQRVRDEAHRFANARREKRLDQSMTHSKLDEVPGIGEHTRSALLKRFGSADGALEAEDTDLLSVLTQTQLTELRKCFPRKIS